MSIEIKSLHTGDEKILANVAAGVFDNPVDPGLTAEFLADPRHHIVVAIDDNSVVGFASALHYVHPDKKPELWINEIALAPAYRNRGLGKRLLRAILEVGRSLQCTEGWVLTDEKNVAARALYSSVGGTEGVGGTGPGDPIVGYSFDLSK